MGLDFLKDDMWFVMDAFHRLDKGKSFNEDALLTYMVHHLSISLIQAKEYLDILCKRKSIFRHEGYIELNRERETQKEMMSKHYPNGLPD